MNRHVVPGYRQLRRMLLRALRRSPAAVRVARLLTDDEVTDHRPMGIRPGRYFDGVDARALPVVVIVATGLHDGDAERLAHEFERAQMMTGTFRPLFVIDSAELGPFRRRGYAVEHVLRPEELGELCPGDSYSEYLFMRVQSIARRYGASSVVPLPSGAPAALSGPMARLVGVTSREHS